VKTDLSLVNRYIEWRVLFRFIRASPLVGYGFGARYFDYDWLLGYSLWTGYSHNAFLYVLLKSGVIGFTALFGAFVLLMFRALKLSRSIYLKANQRAAMRVAFALSFTMLITSMTLNALGDRTALVWLGIVWGSVMIYNREEKRLSHL
jgi:O-antigen ligase